MPSSDRKKTTKLVVRALEKVLVKHAQARGTHKVRKYRAHTLAKAVAKHVAKTTTLDAWKKQMRAIIIQVANADLGFFDFTVDAVLTIKQKQIARRNKTHLGSQIKAVTNHYSPTQLARLAAQAENQTGKGSMTQGHDPA